MTAEAEVSDRELGQMEPPDPSVQRDASTQPESNKEEQLESSENGDRRDITKQDERQRLDYRPTVLTDWALAVSMIVNFAIIAGLVAFIKRPEFNLNTESWLALNAILISVGTGTVAHLQSLFLNLSRITPFMLCAAPGGALARDSILGSYFPAPSFRLILKTRNWMLLTAHMIQYLSYSVIGFKTALLYKRADDPTVHVQDWACFALLAFYGIIQLELVVLIAERGIDIKEELNRVTTRRYENWLKLLEQHIDSSSSEIHVDEDEAPDETALDEPKPASDGASGVAHQNAENNDTSPIVQTPSIRTRAISKRDLALIRYNSSWGVASPISIYIHSSLAFLFMIAFIIAISTPDLPGPEGCKGLGALPHDGAVIIFDTILTIIVAQISGYLIDFAMVTAHTEPFAQMSTASGGPANSTLLLNYTCSPAPAAVYRALMNGHYKVARIAIWALIHRILPTLYGISTIVHPVEDSSSSVICFNLPLSIANIVGFAICGGLILLEALQSPLSRRTPRDWCSIADILSWSTTTSLLQPGNFETDTVDPYRNDPLHMAADGPLAERWHMQARLRLQEKRFRLGFAQVPGTENYAFGITEDEPETLPEVKVSVFSRKVVSLDPDEENGQAGTLDVVVGSGDMVVLPGTSEGTRAHYNDGVEVAVPENEEERI
ncbi:hypothetical protein CMUS01_09413 [Colletotrichum musicola]|uniref:Uncharacterized protein n=1 Tax=Colletotrichum musicola TaxID=2175873 RepID=A0A8H6K8I9_9PEZI|nr:hypothetical protein CMUS01_09413 [Colletotrichum musicola]